MLKDSMLKCRHGVRVPQGAGKTFQPQEKKNEDTLSLPAHESLTLLVSQCERCNLLEL